MIANVYRMANGLVAVFDGNGKQIPEYQGPEEEVADKIKRDSGPETVFHFHGGFLSWRKAWKRKVVEPIVECNCGASRDPGACGHHPSCPKKAVEG